ncbi:hypothetical protein [Anaerosinus massiliensis]|uniref:hypothetical protein n=1 Tax=Massilibacillus massiliensis TaxID=1806837 RepID=UPI000DA622BD|nr:hypothetical protein [Massilibacillus massiliensis]
MKIEVVNTGFKINETPLEEIDIKNSRVTVIFDDAFEKRRKISFCPYQGVKITTIDCVNVNSFLINGKRSFNMLEVADSQWLIILKENLRKNDYTAEFLEKAHHYVLPFQDTMLEIIAWDNFIVE